MSATKHTPGPLHAVASKINGDYAVFTSGGGLVAEFFEAIHHHDERATEEALANAKLFAAASGLLHGLKRATGLLVSLSTECRTAYLDGERVDTLAAAEHFDSLIAKATGEAA